MPNRTDNFFNFLSFDLDQSESETPIDGLHELDEELLSGSLDNLPSLTKKEYHRIVDSEPSASESRKLDDGVVPIFSGNFSFLMPGKYPFEFKSDSDTLLSLDKPDPFDPLYFTQTK